ncbi:MAG: hypothetical protein ACYC63_20670 [Armatimonadota bacterium]
MPDPKEKKAQLPIAPKAIATNGLSRDDMLTILMRHDALCRAYFKNDRRLFPGRSVDISLGTSLLAATATLLEEAGHKPAPLITDAHKQRSR